MKIFKNVIKHSDGICDIKHFPSNNFAHISNNLVRKVHAVCFYNNKIVVVNHKEWNIWGIPGGTRENKETPEKLFQER